jgi:hypothetical protein
VKRLLLLLFVVGAAVYLLAPPGAVPIRNEIAVTQARVDSNQARADSNQNAGVALRTSWGASLQSFRKKPAASARTEEGTRYRQVAAYEKSPSQEETGPQQLGTVAVTTSIDQASTTETGAPDQKAKQWARLTLAATLYSEPTLSSPIAGYFSPGKEVQIREYRNGWFRVQNPGTQETGWIFYKYLEYIHGPSAPPAQIATTAEPTANPPANAISPTSRKPTQAANPTGDRKVVQRHDHRSAERAKRRKVAETGKRRRGLLGLFKRRQARRAWSVGLAH